MKAPVKVELGMRVKPQRLRSFARKRRGLRMTGTGKL